ncbi:MAG: hypothetical protein AAB462_00405 [Patescibacteria group bacterium]
MSNIKELPPTPVEMIDARISETTRAGQKALRHLIDSFSAAAPSVGFTVYSVGEQDPAATILGTTVAVISLGAAKNFYDTRRDRQREEHELWVERLEYTNPKPVVAQSLEPTSAAEKVRPYLVAGAVLTGLSAALEIVVGQRAQPEVEQPEQHIAANQQD